MPVFTSSTNPNDVHDILQDGARGILLSPYSKVSKDKTRMDILNNLIPELQKGSDTTLKILGPVENELHIGKYPLLKHVIQNSHASINGAIKFKHFTVYANPSLNTNSLPSITDSDKCVRFCINSSTVAFYLLTS